MEALKQSIREKGKMVVAFSGGVDSAYLAYCAKKYAQNMLAIYYQSEFQPEFEFEDAKRLCREIGAELTVMPDGEHWFHTEEQLRFLDAWITEDAGR